MSDIESARCPDCQVATGQPHDNGCDVARCTECGHQRISCHHDDSDIGWGQTWTGTWPGVADATRLGWWSLFEPGTGWKSCSATTPGAEPDLNRLCLGEARWNRDTQTWELVTANRAWLFMLLNGKDPTPKIGRTLRPEGLVTPYGSRAEGDI